MAEQQDRRAIAAGGIGSVLEWYDFAVYAFLAPVLAAHFFPTGDQATSLIAAFGVFAGGYLMRPIGAVILGHIGDRISRRAALMVAVNLMAVSTGAIALLPTYATIGIAAPIALTILRLLQGLSVGGEYTGAVVLLGEAAPARHRALFCSVALASGFVGILIASGATTLVVDALSDQAFSDWGWRLLYAPAPLLGVVGYVLRRRLAEVDMHTRSALLPIVATVREHDRALLRIAGIASASAIGNYMVFIYGPTFLTNTVGLPRSTALAATTAGNAALIVTVIGSAWVADRIGRRPMILSGAIGLLVLSYPLFMLLASGMAGLAVVGLLAFAVLIGTISGCFAAVMLELFPHAVRYTGTSVAYGLTFGIVGGTTPLVAISLIDATGNSMSPVFYLMAAAAICVVTVLLTPETRNRPFDVPSTQENTGSRTATKRAAKSAIGG
ncbi:MFS transporter [Bauldia sp.]|uniref:MFS transporter n=1 Tax=Bauldia sp. TaxID=2575872 RepID=UPI003BAA06D3